MVIPLFHNVIPVSLETMRLDVERTGTDALITGDNLRVDVQAEFYIKVLKKEEDVIAAATSLGERSVDAESVKKLVFQKLVSALRTVAATRPLNELHTKRDDFATAVQSIVEKDLAPNGLTLESVTISKLDQTPPTDMRGDQNVFDAQGLRTIAEITQAQRVARNMIEREADQKVKSQDVSTAKFIYEQEIAQATAEAQKQADILKAQAQSRQEAETFRAQQETLEGVAIEQRNQAVQIAAVQRQQAIDVENQRREQAEKQAEIDKLRALEIAEREKQIAVAIKEKERAQAEAEQLAMEKEREQQHQSVLTVEVTQTAEREKAKAVITEQADIEKTRLREQMQADVLAYQMVKEAEGERESAEKKASARLTLAEAEQKAKSLEAEGERAVQMVPVNVDREKVEVERARVDVKREDLKNQAEFESIARELQVELARIAADRDAKIAAAEAFAKAFSSAKMTLWGDPASLNKMVQAFYAGQKNGQYVEGLTSALPDDIKNLASGALSGLGAVGAALVKRLTGNDVDPAAVETALKAMQIGDSDGKEKPNPDSAEAPTSK
ncbi:MAG TPA: SPFH domain-containing protein [Armatimonadota bacterium]|nr:SPFH domain-containing protein [Armatimonadota bacterium]